MNTKYRTGQKVYYIEKIKSDLNNTYGFLIQKLTITNIIIKDGSIGHGYYYGVAINYGFDEIKNNYNEKDLIETLEEVYAKIKYELE